ncbi:hypothetical protein B0T10DRAFT_466393 [Thelonectria olida]|uniref:Uncharacterized protein n=1 Tax=Thelonectria olida TaxID=1576542 RepID=A0A9P9AIQ9_9HYPO|nr:hypothetical protein B0T10DRAFT_466393 [Thelonectria olida]
MAIAPSTSMEYHDVRRSALAEFASDCNNGEENTPYSYLTYRPADLQSELENPWPRGWFERQMERKSGARDVMMATLIGIGFAVMLGMESLAVSSLVELDRGLVTNVAHQVAKS